MKNFNAYVKDANRLCQEILGARDANNANKKLNCMQEKINHSRLNIYQKDSLIQQLHSISEILLMRKLWREVEKSHDMFF